MLELFQISPLIFVASVFVLSLLIGSFLNVVIYRLPIMMEQEWRAHCKDLNETPATAIPAGHFNLIFPQSHCSFCGAQITILKNIPILSYLILNGKCSSCDTAISRRYPIVESLTAILTTIVAWRFGFGWESAAAVVLTWSLIAISAIDIDHHIIPDSISLPLIWIGFSLSLFHPMVGTEVLFIDPKTGIIGALAGYLSLWCIYQLFRLITGKEGMGYGDFKLLAALGAWLGWQMLPLIILLSAIVGAAVGSTMIILHRHDRNVPIPFGPYLATAGWIVMLYGEQMITSYFDLMS
jgi:leader peptidase (prepilin peptidase)/N-methyltransferase